MIARYGSPGFNAGAFGSRKSVMSETLLWQCAERAATQRHLFEPMQVDQPFLNYVFDTLPGGMISLHELLPNITPKPWARVPFRVDFETSRATDEAGCQMPFIHWAGCHYPTMVRKEIFLYYRTLEMNFWERLWYHQRFYRHRWKKRVDEIIGR